MNSPAYTYALRLLTKRDYSRAKLREKLLQREFDEEDVETCLDQLVTKRFLREELYAEARIKGLMLRGNSPEMIQQRLAAEDCMVENDFINQVYQEHQLDPDQQLKNLLAKKLRQSKYQDSDEMSFEAKQKIVAFVARKGHSPQAAFKLLDELLREQNH